MVIHFFDVNNRSFFNQSSKLLSENFECWSNISEAENEILDICIDKNIVLIAIDEDEVVGLIGAQPKYDGNVWEVHPIVVKKEMQRNGIGKRMLVTLESEVAKRGGITIYLGTDDENNSTSLSSVDIYENLFDKINNIENINNHPFEFYQKCGYKIVGVVPDANGIGKPDIMLAKRIKG